MTRVWHFFFSLITGSTVAPGLSNPPLASMGQPAVDDLDVLVSSRRLDFLIVGVGGGTMLDYMDYIQLAFAEATNWNRDNSYSSLTTTAQCKSVQG